MTEARKLKFSVAAEKSLKALETGALANAAKLRKVRKTLALLQVNPRHPGLHSHEYSSFPGHEKSKVWDSYVENNTPGAWRVFWMYGPDEKDIYENRIPVITILAITDHP